jgi:hypothetical protein
MRLRLAALYCLLVAATTARADLPAVNRVELQPLAAQAKRLAEALELVGSPLPASELEALRTASADADSARGVAAIQEILDKHCLAGVRVDSRKEIVASPGAAPAELAEQGWRVFVVKVDNAAGIDDLELHAVSPNSLPLSRTSTNKPDPKVLPFAEVEKRFLDLMMFSRQPLLPKLSGLELEYRLLQVYCRGSGRKQARLAFALWKPSGKRSQRIATSNDVPYLFESKPAVLVRLHVFDDDGRPTVASFTTKDAQGRVYPSMSRRLAPDFGFQPQVYRGDGETLSLQPGRYSVVCTRGPEYLATAREIVVPQTATTSEEVRLRRWIHPSERGWYSGDHHVHAAGCAHYESPTEGVTPEDMMRHVLGEDLDVGCCLSWGPCWYHQKRYFEGKTSALSTPEHLLRYDVEVSGFPSSHCGHLCLLRLREQDYPGTKLIEDWPSWDLPILRWAKSQGAVVGFAHSGWGLDAGSTRELPNEIVPPMSGVGANEYVMDVTHGLCDFISTVDTPAVWELNMWYHTLNCGYRCRISGETDFPCIYGDRVGLGRSYVHLDGKLDFDAWAEGIRRGRSYVSDGKSHLMDFAVNGVAVGAGESEIKLPAAASVRVTARVAARLEPAPTAASERVRKSKLDSQPYWDLERARIGDSRRVPLELVVNGRVAASREIVADGKEQEIAFDVPVQQSSWICLRILPSSHTNPLFVLVGERPIRVSKRSASWCLKALEKCWEQKRPAIRAGERKEAEAAYDEARRAYQKILSETDGD